MGLKKFFKKKKTACEDNITKSVFNNTIDSVLRKIGKIARERLEKTPPEKRTKILYFIGYHQAKFVALLDAINILALQFRNAEVYTVSSAYFYQKEDVIFGGIYNENRFEQQYNLHQNENVLFTDILQTKLISIDSFIHKSDIEFAQNFAQQSDPKNWQDITYEGLNVGEMCYYLVANMNNQPYMFFNEDQIEQFRCHIVNCINLYTASLRLLESSKPDRIVSNVPFYYQWKIPFFNAMKLNIPAYAYMLAERKNAVFWTSNSFAFFDSKNSWETFKRSNMTKEYMHLVEQGIKDRFEGNISNHKFAPNAEQKNEKLEEIKNKVKGKPTILFPCNILVDAAVLTSTQAFSSCIEMLEEVINWFKNHPEYCCIMKAHPAERLLADVNVDISKIHLSYILKERGITLPNNIIFIDFDEKISVYSLFEIVQGIISYSSSVCMDAGFFGKQSISALNAHYAVADFAKVPKSKDDFFIQMESLLRADKNYIKTPDEISKLAKEYYLLYYYISQVDYKLLQGNDLGTYPLEIFFDSEESFLPGNNKGLDYICDAILNNKPIFDDNRWPPITM